MYTGKGLAQNPEPTGRRGKRGERISEYGNNIQEMAKV
jgi:hypothetical protein